MNVTITKNDIKSYFRLVNNTPDASLAVRLPVVEHETHVPLLYAITGTNLNFDYYGNELRDLAKEYMDNFVIQCVDYRKVKGIRKEVLRIMLEKDDGAGVEISEVEEIFIKRNTFSKLSFPERKELMKNLGDAIAFNTQ